MEHNFVLFINSTLKTCWFRRLGRKEWKRYISEKKKTSPSITYFVILISRIICSRNTLVKSLFNNKNLLKVVLILFYVDNGNTSLKNISKGW
jgi:hypothetical protein